MNCTNLFDAACGFGGYRESGYGREGGKEGMLEYLEPTWFKNAPKLPAARQSDTAPPRQNEEPPKRHACHRSHREAIHRRQTGAARFRLQLRSALPLTGVCSAKLRSAIAKTFATPSKRRAKRRAGRRATAHNRAQVLYYLRKIFRSAATRSPRLAASRRREASRGRSRSRHRAHIFLCSVDGQI